MKNRLAFCAVTLIGVSTLLAACSGDDDDTQGGQAGTSAAGKGTGGAASGGKGNSAGSAGKAQAGSAGSAGTTNGGASTSGGDANGGAGGDTMEPSEGGAGGAIGAGGATENGGAGGASSEPLAYACGTTSINHKLCSALYAADCTEAVDCADCVTSRASEHETFTECPACAAEHDAFMQCGIDAYEAGMLSDGIECYDGYADLNDNCAPHFNAAVACSTYLLEHDCPASWPVN